jgi:aryl-alcohol dehydrogenase-like predicted oxidoreductase
MGTAEFGSQTLDDESFAMLDAFAEAGGNIADTAHIYAA